MTNPQLEDGYTRIANELLEALARYRIPGEQRQVFDVIVRMTYGYRRTWHQMTLQDFVSKTGLKKSKICLVNNLLITSQLIVIKYDNEKRVSYKIQKDFTKWKPLTKKITNPKGRPLTKKITTINNNDNESLTNMITNVNSNDNPTPKKPIQAIGLQDPKENLKKKERKLKERGGQNVDNSDSQNKDKLSHFSSIIKKQTIPEPKEP